MSERIPLDSDAIKQLVQALTGDEDVDLAGVTYTEIKLDAMFQEQAALLDKHMSLAHSVRQVEMILVSHTLRSYGALIGTLLAQYVKPEHYMHVVNELVTTSMKETIVVMQRALAERRAEEAIDKAKEPGL